MATEEFSKKLRLNNKNKHQLSVINDIIEEYRREGYFKHWQMIPRGMVKKITKLKEVKK